MFKNDIFVSLPYTSGSSGLELVGDDLHYPIMMKIEMIICGIQVGKSVHQAEKINRNDVDNGIWGWFLNIFSCRQPMCV